MLPPQDRERDCRQVVERWTRDGQPDRVTCVAQRSSEATRRNARAGLIWHFRVNLGRTMDIPSSTSSKLETSFQGTRDRMRLMMCGSAAAETTRVCATETHMADDHRPTSGTLARLR